MSFPKSISKLLKNPKIRRTLVIITIILILAVSVFIILNGNNYFKRRNIRQMQRLVQSFGFLSPLVIVFLILLSTVIPPLPIPVPVVELAAGVVYGFFEGFVVVWIAQVVSSLSAFYISRILRKTVFSSLTQNRSWEPYRQYLNRKGAQAVMITRLLMAAPFNIISYLAGLTRMELPSFLGATVIGTIPESAIYSFIGSRLRGSHFNLWYVFVLVVGTGAIGIIFTLLMLRSIRRSAKRTILKK